MSATSHPVNVKSVEDFVAEQWKNGIYESLCEYIKVPNRSPGFDPTCLTNGLQDKAMEVLVNWVKTQQVHGMKYQVHSEPDRTPLLLINIDGTNNTSETLLMYGHMDKQPPMDEVKGAWEHGSGPWTPVLHDGKLYGRGGADDGYAIFAAITAIRALQLQKVAHARIVILIEACEESGSKDLPYYVDKFSAEIGVPSLVICLDSGCHNYEQLWLTTSLRGVLVGTLSVKILDEAVHSGMASGIVPSSFRVTRQLLDRLEDSKTGKMIDIFNVPIPDEHHRYAQEVAHTIGNIIHTRFRFVKGAHAVETNNAENLLNATWRPTLSVTGAEGLPPLGSASNVVRTETKLKLSIRLPPTLDCTALAGQVKAVLEANPPYGAQVSFDGVTAMQGWCAPKLDSWLEKSLNDASNSYFKKPVRLTGEGGSIPFMGMLGAKFPKTQFVITGILGPSSNAHAPNEFLHVGMFHGVSACVANIVADHYTHKVHA